MKNIPLEDALKTVALSPNVVSRKPIFEKYDKNVQGNTFVERGQAAVSVILPFNDFPELPQDKKAIGVAVGTGGNPNVAMVDAGMAAEMGICEAALKLSCVGGTWLGATDCLNFGNPEKEAPMGEFVAAVEGLKTACSTLQIPIVSGNVSLYNESDGKSVPPSALVSVFGRVDDIKTIKPSYWGSAEAFIYQVGPGTASLAGSEFNRLFELESTELPSLDYQQVKADAEKLEALVKNTDVEAIMPLSAGGVWGTLLSGALVSGQGFELTLDSQTAVADLFAETLGAIVISRTELPDLKLLGKTKSTLMAEVEIDQNRHSIDLSVVKSEWDNQLRSIF